MGVALKELIENFIISQDKPFRLKEIFAFINSRIDEDVPFLEERISNLLEREILIFFDEEKDLYIPRSLYFKNALFLIQPTPMEITEKILVPGHRFLPFCHPEIFPPNVTLVTEKGRQISSTTIKKNLEDLIIYHTLLGREKLNEYLIFDHEANSELLNSEYPEMEKVLITVMDLEEFYENNQFRLGDAIVLKVLDWMEGRYSLAYSPASERMDKRRRNRWIKELNRGFDRAFVNLGLPVDMEEQIAYAFYNAGPWLIQNPVLHLGGGVTESKLFTFKEVGGKNFLWYEDEEPGLEDFIQLQDLTGNFDSLEDILKDVKSPVSNVEIEAYMRDELFSRSTDFKNVLNRSFGDMEFEFFDEFQEEKFYEYIEELWEKIKKNYNYFTDQKRGKIRNWALGIFNDWHRWLKKLDDRNVHIGMLPQEDIFMISRYLEGLYHTFVICNAETEISEADEGRVYHFLDEAENAIKEMTRVIDLKIKPKLSVVRQEDSGKVFVLKISLKNAKPPIWRRVRIPGSCTLGILHMVIQTAFSWEDYHLHEFRINDYSYGPKEDENTFVEVVDEDSVTLNQLLGEEKQRFLYIYDFGDNWEHQVVVERIFNPEELEQREAFSIACLGGRRGAPPEDCGGIWGYEHMKEVLGDKDHPEYENIIDWLGEELDPEKFDIKDINKKLREID